MGCYFGLVFVWGRFGTQQTAFFTPLGRGVWGLGGLGVWGLRVLLWRLYDHVLYIYSCTGRTGLGMGYQLCALCLRKFLWGCGCKKQGCHQAKGRWSAARGLYARLACDDHYRPMPNF